MNKKIIMGIVSVLLINLCLTYTYSKYVLTESFVAFKIENVISVEDNKKSNTNSNQKVETKQDENVKEDSSVSSGGWIDIVKVEH